MALRVAGQQVEQRRGVLGDRLVGGEQARRRCRAAPWSGCSCPVPRWTYRLQCPPLLPHHQRHLAVGLEVEKAKHHVHAGPLHLPGPADVVGLVEPGLELHQRRHMLARLGRCHQGPRDRRIAAGAVERLLDGQHPGIVGRLGDELDHRIERLVGMVEQDVALGDRALKMSSPCRSQARAAAAA